MNRTVRVGIILAVALLLGFCIGVVAAGAEECPPQSTEEVSRIEVFRISERTFDSLVENGIANDYLLGEAEPSLTFMAVADEEIIEGISDGTGEPITVRVVYALVYGSKQKSLDGNQPDCLLLATKAPEGQKTKAVAAP